MDDDLSFDFENALDAPAPAQQVKCSDHCMPGLQNGSQAHVSRCKSAIHLSVLQNGSQQAPDLPPGAPIGQSIGNYKKNYRQVSQACTCCVLHVVAFLLADSDR